MTTATATDALRRAEAQRRLGVAGACRFDELDELLALVARAAGASGARFVVIDQDVDRVVAEDGPAYRVDRRWSLARTALKAADGRASVVVEPGVERAGLPLFAGADVPVALAAVSVTAPDGEPIGGVVAHWVGEQAVQEPAWAPLEDGARHLGYVLELRADEREYRRFINLNPDPVLVLDVEGAVVIANPAMATLLGHDDPEAMVGRPFLACVARSDRARVTAELARVLFARRRTRQFDVSLLDREGATVATSVSAGHLRGARRHLQLVVHDLSERLRAEEERSTLSEQLARAQRLDAVGHVASGLAHDLNNLLVVMVSNLALAREGLESIDAQVPLRAVCDDLEELQIAVDRASALTSQLLAFAAADEAGSDAADIGEVVAAVLGLVERSLPQGVTLQRSVPSGLPLVAVPPVQLERALLNLVINARDAVGAIGTIEVRASSTADGGRQSVRLEVQDDGSGMDEATLARAFEPLFTTKADAGGSGLGLASVLALTDEVDGVVTIRSTPREGTTVTLVLPVEAAAPESIPVGVDVPVGGARVLLVDPGERTRRVITSMLRGSGYRVTPVATGEEALEILATGADELLITEVALPGRGGAELLEHVRASTQPIPVIVLASVDAPPTLAGVPVLVKPFSHARLLRVVERVLAER